jgi:hypothetical protein
MELPVIRGLIERRILANYRVDPDVLAAQLPAPFRPKVVNGWGIAGICLIRLAQVRPAGLPRWCGVTSENAAHRVAVEWDEDDAVREGVYIRRRDTDSRLNSLLGGRIFPGVHHRARFAVEESAESFDVGVRSDDGVIDMRVRAHRVSAWPARSTFASLDEASAFFAGGSLGYSPGHEPARFEGLELQCDDWNVEALAVDEIRSTYFDDRGTFPAESIELDCALLMRGVAHRWLSRGDLCCIESTSQITRLSAADAAAAWGLEMRRERRAKPQAAGDGAS